MDTYQKWLECADKGAGEIYLAIEDDQKHHLGGVLDNPKINVGIVGMRPPIKETWNSI